MTLNANDLKYSIKNYRLVAWIKTQDLRTYLLPARTIPCGKSMKISIPSKQTVFEKRICYNDIQQFIF